MIYHLQYIFDVDFEFDEVAEILTIRRLGVFDSILNLKSNSGSVLSWSFLVDAHHAYSEFSCPCPSIFHILLQPCTLGPHRCHFRGTV